MKRFAEFMLVISLLFGAIACACNAEPPGTLILTRNADESLNTTPGENNHVLVVATDGTSLIESQAGIGVQRITMEQLRSRPYDHAKTVKLEPRNKAAGVRAAKRAEQLVGKKYARGSSIFRRQGERRQERGLNCWSVAKIAWGPEDRHVKFTKIPDHALRLGGPFAPALPLSPPTAPAPTPAPANTPEPSSNRGTELQCWYQHHPAGCVSGRGILRDVMSRCPRYGLAQIRHMDRPTQCHEATHFVNHELSSRRAQEYGGFYIGNGRFCILPRTGITIGMVARRVPPAQRTGRYVMYLTGDRVQRDCLSILDEWTCYANDAQCTQELGLPTDGGLKFAHEFSGFADCLLQTVKDTDPAYPALAELEHFIDWQKTRVAKLSR